jgi:hypothetical protein
MLLVAILCHTGAAGAAVWHENFDGLPVGSITNHPGWESTLGYGGLAACSVANVNPHLGPHSLYIGATGILVDRKVAVYRGVSHAYSGTNERIVRLSAWVHRASAAQYFSLMLGTNGTGFVTLGTNLDGTIRVNGIDTGVSWVVGRYARVALWYDMAADKVALDYDGTNIVAWTPLGAGMTRFDEVRVQRTAFGAMDSGAIYVDGLAVETIPLSTWAWWRFDEQTGTRTEDVTGWFSPGKLVAAPPSPWRAPLWDQLIVATNRVQNDSSYAGPKMFSVPVRHGRPPSLDWTFETIFYFDRAATNSFYLFLMNGHASGTDPYGSMVEIWWQSGSPNGIMWARLQDRFVSNGEVSEVAVLPQGAPDDRWHHVAIVKTNDRIVTYVDYQPVYGTLLDTRADGEYYFNDTTRMAIGGASTNFGLIHDSILVDEVRFSGEALGPDAFLRAGRPMIKKIQELRAPARAVLRVAGHPGQWYAIQRSADLKTWINHDVWSNQYLQSDFYTPMPTNPASPAFFRLKESDSPFLP